MNREFHTAHHHDGPGHGRRHHHDEPADQSEPFGDGIPRAGGPGRGRGHHHHGGGRGGRGGPGFLDGPSGPGFGPGGRGFGPEAFGPGGFGPGGFGGRGRRRRPKGAVREAVLSLLADGPANGYSLMKQIAERTDGTWAPSPGSVYPTLAQLVDEGLIVATGTGKGTDFDLTDEGRAYVADNAELLERIWAEGSRGAPSHVALREAVMALMGTVQQFRYASDDQRRLATDKLEATRRDLHAILAE